MRHTRIDAMSAFFLRTVHPPDSEIHLAAYKAVVSVTVCILVITSYFDIAEIGGSCENQVKIVLALRSGVSPGYVVLFLS